MDCTSNQILFACCKLNHFSLTCMNIVYDNPHAFLLVLLDGSLKWNLMGIRWKQWLTPKRKNIFRVCALVCLKFLLSLFFFLNYYFIILLLPIILIRFYDILICSIFIWVILSFECEVHCSLCRRITEFSNNLSGSS